jgi:hypothetical protein
MTTLHYILRYEAGFYKPTSHLLDYSTCNNARLIETLQYLFLLHAFDPNEVFPKQWPLAPNLPKWRITRANVSRQVTFFSKMANVECERMYRVRGNGWRMSGKCIESGENGWQMSGECIESGQSRVANVGASKIGHFMHK